MFFAGIALGAGLGLVTGLLVGQYLLRWGLEAISETINKVSYSIRFPSPPELPVQVETQSEEVLKDLEQDDERVPDWMDEEYSLR